MTNLLLISENNSRDRVVNISGYTRAMLKTMTKSLQIPHFGYKDEIDMNALIAIRRDLAEHAKRHGLKLSYMPFFIKAASVALHEVCGTSQSSGRRIENLLGIVVRSERYLSSTA